MNTCILNEGIFVSCDVELGSYCKTLDIWLVVSLVTSYILHMIIQNFYMVSWL